jgi:2-polyprenyl-6-methoxyphenol hydroxylase-like FAD-dependent oxidoreductase
VDPLERLPSAFSDRGGHPGDERLHSVTARRTTLEHVVGTVAASEPRLTIRRGLRVVGLTTRARDGITHVTGVRLDSRSSIEADVVVDAMGRRSPLPE